MTSSRRTVYNVVTEQRREAYYNNRLCIEGTFSFSCRLRANDSTNLCQMIKIDHKIINTTTMIKDLKTLNLCVSCSKTSHSSCHSSRLAISAMAAMIGETWKTTQHSRPSFFPSPNDVCVMNAWCTWPLTVTTVAPKYWKVVYNTFNQRSLIFISYLVILTISQILYCA